MALNQELRSHMWVYVTSFRAASIYRPLDYKPSKSLRPNSNFFMYMHQLFHTFSVIYCNLLRVIVGYGPLVQRM